VFDEPLVTKGTGGVVIVRSIDFASTCDATLMPFHGQCHVAYVPAVQAVLGLSKLARLVNVLSKRLSSQQGLAQAIVDAVAACLSCKGVLALVQARHMSRACEATPVTACASSGCFAEDSAEREVRSLQLKRLAFPPLSPLTPPSQPLRRPCCCCSWRAWSSRRRRTPLPHSPCSQPFHRQPVCPTQWP